MYSFLQEYLTAIIGITTTSLVFFVLYLNQKKITMLHRNRENIFTIISRLANHPVMIISSNHQIIYTNKQMQKYIEATTGDSLNTVDKLPLFLIEREEKGFVDLIDAHQKETLDDIRYIANAIIKYHDNKKPVSLRLSSVSIDRKSIYTGIAIFDTSEQLELSRIHYQNTATGLPNHNQAMIDIGLVAHDYALTKKRFAVAVFSIDNILEIISILGHKDSLHMISLVAKYLQTISVQNNLKLYHMTENNFLLVFPSVQTTQRVKQRVEKYKTDCEALLYNTNAQLQYTLSSGISIYPDNGIGNLLNSAFGALSLAKKQGLGYTIVAQSDHEASGANASIQYSEIKEALEKREFSLHYQPIFDAKKEMVVAAEALIRWIHPTKGMISPGSFLPLVENTSFMKQLGEYVAREAITQLSTWKNLGFREIQVSINLSLREFESMDYFKILDALLDEHQIETSQLKVEVTENIAMHNEKYSIVQFQKLNKLGIGISLDDFGTGYSSFSILGAFPIDTLKIDQSFVKDLSENKDHQTIVKAMIAMAHSLDIKVIAEGIEDQHAAKILKKINCDYMQGYHLGRPIPAFEFQELIRSAEQISNSDDIIALQPQE